MLIIQLKNAMVNREHINNQYLDCNENFKDLEESVCQKILKL